MRQDWIWHGGRPCLDLINTRRERWSAEPRELLVAPADLAEWLHAAGLVDRPTDVSAELLGQARELREAVDRVLRADRLRAEDVALVAADAVAQVRICAHQRCGLRFLDRSPAHNRQWCSMRRCGNRAKSSRHHARHAQGPSALD